MRCEKKFEQAGAEHGSHGSAFGFLVAGLGIGAVLSVLMAPRSGAETRARIATKCLDGVEAANAGVCRVRMRVHEIVDEGQQKVTEAVAAGREIFGKTDARTSTPAL